MLDFTTKRLNNFLKAATLGGVAMAALAGGTAQAATQGTLGATSTGSVTITVSVPNRARITNLSDITIANQDPNTAINSAQNVCVWSNTATKNYTVTATGSGVSSAFTLANSTLTVPYSVEWAGSTGQTSGTALTAGTASAAFTSGAANQACTTGNSASLVVNMSTGDLGSMQSQTNYTGTLTLVVTPQ